MKRPLSLIYLLLLAACDDPLGTWPGDNEQWVGGETGLGVDQDGDGYTVEAGDCDDFDASVYPEATDGLLTDRSCDGILSSDNLVAAEYGFLGEVENDHAGRAVASAGDVDGDGLDDILIGAWKNSEGGIDAGKAYVVLASSLLEVSSSSRASRKTDLADADYAFIGQEAGDNAGHSVASAGDVDGDGLDDILIGVEKDDLGGDDAGKACVFRGSQLSAKASFSVGSAAICILGESESDKAGRAVSSAGDVDGDGLADVLVGAYGNDEVGENAGKIYVFYGSSFGSGLNLAYDFSAADISMTGEGAGENAGYSVASAGDVDGDGYSDVLIGATGNDEVADNAGKTYLVFGSTMNDVESIELADSDLSFLGEASEDYAGRTVAGAGDVDGDSLHDVMIGAWKNSENATGSGKAYVILGSTLTGAVKINLENASHSFSGFAEKDYAGTSVAVAGDVDGDGLSDALVGAYGTGEGAGSLYVLLGANLAGASSVDYAFHGENIADYAGNSVSYAGDVDGNGRDDLLVGSWAHNGNSGKTYLVLSGL